MVRTKRYKPTLKDKIRQNWKFAALMVGLCSVVAIATGIATQGLENMIAKATLAAKAISDPNKLSTEEKSQLKKMVKDKGAKGAFDNMSAEQKQRAKEALGGMSDADKERYKKMFGAK